MPSAAELLVKLQLSAEWMTSQVAVDAEAVVKAVEEDAPFGDSLRIGDKIVEIDGEEVTDRAQLRGALASRDRSRSVAVVVSRSTSGGKDSAITGTASQVFSGVFAPAEFDPAGSNLASQVAAHGDGHRASLIEITPPDDAPQHNASEQHLHTSKHTSGDTLRAKLAQCIDQVTSARCVLVLCDSEYSPVDEIKLLAEQRQAQTPFFVNAALKMRHLSTDATFTAAFKTAMSRGAWFVLLRATKAMRLAELLASLVSELRDRNCEGVHESARVLVTCEPHPHFPDALTAGAKTLRIRTMPMANSSLILDSISNSSSCRRLVHGEVAVVKAMQRRVQLSHAVEVVEIAPRDVVTMAESTLIPILFRDTSTVEPLQLEGVFRGLPDDKFYGINFAGDTTRLAVCSSLGNVYFIDSAGAGLASFHAHDSAVWDLSFSGAYDLVTGGEDGLAVVWTREGQADVDTLVCREVLNFDNDVYSVRHTETKELVAFGGFLPHVAVHSVAASDASKQLIPIATSVQALCPLWDNHMVAAGADGKVMILDCVAGTLVSATQRHTKKCPCVAVRDSTVISGSFDGTIKLFDVRAGTQRTTAPTSIKFSAAVTGIAAGGNLMAACVGESLHLWDVRKLDAALATQKSAWKGLSRGIVIDAATGMIATASPDGSARFWSFDS